MAAGTKNEKAETTWNVTVPGGPCSEDVGESGNVADCGGNA